VEEPAAWLRCLPPSAFQLRRQPSAVSFPAAADGWRSLHLCALPGFLFSLRLFFLQISAAVADEMFVGRLFWGHSRAAVNYGAFGLLFTQAL
jgi:hypothetical protein